MDSLGKNTVEQWTRVRYSMDLHHNIFYGYRGPIPETADRERQLENNVTKALINTLSLGGSAVWRPFLAELGLANAKRAKFLLQRRDLPSASAAKKRDRVLLGICKRPSAWATVQGAEPPYAGVPDAWIYGDGFAVLLECKGSAGDFSPAQMQAHLARLRSRTSPKVVRKTWHQAHLFFRGLLPSLTQPLSRLLTEQFIQFLEYSGMTEFTGFQPDHFQYFLMHDDDDARRWVREQMGFFAAQVLGQLRAFVPFYDAYDVGNLGANDTGCWVAFGPPSPSYRAVTHQTISLKSDGLHVFTNTELKKHTDMLKKVLNSSENTLRAALKKMHASEPYELVVKERVRRQASLYDYNPKLRLHSSILVGSTGEAVWRAFTETVTQLPLPNLLVERIIPARKLLALSATGPDKAVQHVVKMLKHNHGFVELLNRDTE
jgi:hypothetical protein